MSKYHIPRKFTLRDIPLYKEFQEDNPDSDIDEKACALNFGEAIHWMSILQILWPDFEQIDYYSFEVAYVIVNDPDEQKIPKEWHHQIAETIVMFWRIQLEDLYPDGNWEAWVEDDPEITAYAVIHNRV